MENNKLLYAIFTIGIVILVLLIVQMFIMIPAVMHGGYNRCPQPVMSSAPAMPPAPAFGCHHWCHPHKHMMPPKPGFFKEQPKPGVQPKAPAEPQKPATPAPQTK